MGAGAVAAPAPPTVICTARLLLCLATITTFAVLRRNSKSKPPTIPELEAGTHEEFFERYTK